MIQLDFLNKKSIYIAPYNNLAKELKHALEKGLNSYIFHGYIDTYKKAENIQNPSDKLIEFDYILIISPNYFKEINTVLFSHGVK